MELISFILTNFPFSMWILGLFLGVFSLMIKPVAPGEKLRRILNYLLFFSVALPGYWAAVMHCGFPTFTAHFIGWQPSPFQWEVGVANLGMGLLGMFAAFAHSSFKKATVLLATTFYWGVAIGHIKQMVVMHNFAPGNAGSIFWAAVVIPISLITLLALSRKRKNHLVVSR